MYSSVNLDKALKDVDDFRGARSSNPTDFSLYNKAENNLIYGTYSPAAGDASDQVKHRIIQKIITEGRDQGLDSNGIAYLIATAAKESGFNPMAATSGNSQAHGVGQLLPSVAKHYGISENDYWDENQQIRAFVEHTLDNIRYVQLNSSTFDWGLVYLYHHDGYPTATGAINSGNPNKTGWYKIGLSDVAGNMNDAKIYVEIFDRYKNESSSDNLTDNQCTIDGLVTAEHTQFSNELMTHLPDEDVINSCQVHLETSEKVGNLRVSGSNLTRSKTDTTTQESTSFFDSIINSIIDALTPKEASAAELNMSYAGELDKLNIIVEDDTGISETRTVSMEFGYIRIDDEPVFVLDNFHFDVDRFINNGDDPLVTYDISHNGNEDIRGVKLKFYATKNGELDGEEIYLEYERAGTLSKGEINNESQAFDTLTELPGDWIIVTTVEYEGGGDPVVLRTDTVSIPAAQEIPEMQSVRLRNDDAVNDDGDLRIDYVLENSTDKDMRGFEVKFYASKINSFNESTAIYLDRESAGTLRSGERDSEGETIRSAADLNAGDWNLFSVAYWDGQDEGMVLSTNQFTVEDNTADIDLAVEDFRADDHVLDVGQDLKVRQTSVNYGSDDARSTKTTYFWSEDKHFNIRDDIKIDTDTHGTLRAGEHDTNEYERIDYEDLPKGLGYVFALIDADHEFDEGLANETNNLSDALTIYVA